MLGYALVACTAGVLFGTHWARDSLGALELPLEESSVNGGFNMTSRAYNSLGAVFFFPNIPAPLISGILAQKLGPAVAYLIVLGIALAGNSLVAGAAILAAREPFGLLVAGRLLMGVAYEASDILPIGLLSPYFGKDRWASLIGVLNGSNRIGSVCNFLLMPMILRHAGLRAALALASVVGAGTFVFGLLAWRVDRALRRNQERLVWASSAPASECAPASDPQPPKELSLASLGAFSRSYWLYAVGAGCVYGAVVPFWFIGAKHIALKWSYSLSAADAFMLWPEGAIALIAPPFGWLIDRHSWSLRRRLLASACAQAIVALALALLALSPWDPLVGVGLLGVGYAMAQNLVWATITSISPPLLINLSAGVIGAALNVLPTFLPIVFSGDGEQDVSILAVVAAVGVLAYACSAFLVECELQPQTGQSSRETSTS